MEVQNSAAAQICVIVNRSDQEVSHHHSPSRLQAEHFGIQNTARLQREETHRVKQEMQCKCTQPNTKQTTAKIKTKEIYSIEKCTWGVQYIWRSIQDKINDRRGGVQHREKGGKHHGQKTKLFHINVICGLKTESFAALGASGQICLLCNNPSSLTKMFSLKHKSFSEKRGIKG